MYSRFMLKHLLKDTAIYGLTDFLFKFISFATFPIYSYIFEVEDYGILALITTLATLTTTIFNCGLNNAVSRYYWELDTTINRRAMLVSTGLFCLTSFALITFLVTSCMFYFSGDFLMEKYQIKWQWLVLGIVSIIPIQITQFCGDVIRLHFSPWKFTLITASQNLMTILLSLLLTWKWQFGIMGFLVGSFIGGLLVIPLSLWIIRKDLTLRFNWDYAKMLVRFGSPFIAASLAYWIFGSIDRWMLAELSTTEEVGLYSIAFKFATILIFLNSAFGQAWSPHVMKIYSTDPNYRTILSRFFSLWLYFLAFVGIGLSLFSTEVLQLLTPPSYWPAANILPFILMGIVFCGTTQFTAVGISIEKKTYILSVVSWITAAINFLLNLILIPSYGALGAAGATLFAYFFMTSAYFFCSQRLHPLPLEYTKLSACLCIILGGIVVSFLLTFYPFSFQMICLKLSMMVMLIVLGFIFKIIDSSYLMTWLSVKREPKFEPDIK